MPDRPLADEVWRTMASLVLDNRDGWRRTVVEMTGLPFSRVRILRRLARQSMTMKGIAEATALDAPAATVAVSDLERRGLVVRRVDPENRRCKRVSLTDEGRELVEAIADLDDPAPAALTALDETDLNSLHALLRKALGGRS
ncbi:MarR family winged helix-turn-helix transcriptional regulator [Mycobacteroides immunogenum]|uniref:MarR family transcriptional regulator n=2 Tax=Mycobacteroides immunogenum TaxID=83262 RepID=A0A7V8RUF5_9MYCO|nr:MarR family transcriptional regulator [Mycobacteroides immunogenum]AMT69798.1 MarR family transcriptional regulator [Mycobacteroides immunogenum]ANO02849.1 transcriptional regulator [Mycobacteroides immunogenum]KIU39206.1 MarR family transcriptional regulator [Mycobacteroides immunogenum]KPG03139.1 MarR family transcriptional regulator [Mycobacteroides immunogenum]KPG03854.1 MarR family transcriptional regulator [Mycobacteroides immunogenum]